MERRRGEGEEGRRWGREGGGGGGGGRRRWGEGGGRCYDGGPASTAASRSPVHKHAIWIPSHCRPLDQRARAVF